MSLSAEIITLLNHTLGLSDGTLDESTALLGSIPEFDSMAVVTLITTLEEQYGIEVDDDEIDASVFESVSSVTEFVASKVS